MKYCKPMNSTNLGDRNINLSVGSEWRYRIDDLEKQIMGYAITISKVQGIMLN
ncbi:polymorphic toxin type 15 domain-containing protein [Longicatena caecimuris]|uniref:polymorphic toxin type 15 domain-containing protein n=1 Tax=Longicatena caecimuris TaxID=1796635 RepID=UPI003A4DD2FB